MLFIKSLRAPPAPPSDPEADLLSRILAAGLATASAG